MLTGLAQAGRAGIGGSPDCELSYAGRPLLSRQDAASDAHRAEDVQPAESRLPKECHHRVLGVLAGASVVQELARHLAFTAYLANQG